MQFAGRDVEARKDVGGYWKNAMDSQAMPDAIKARIDHPETAGKGVHFAKDFDPGSVDSLFENYNLGYAADPPHPEASGELTN
jgi:hypothetical protein